jgi:hypothetical protein|tara:strand:- start:2031 stop:2366 length:336 start_codon:yes stop_codon:yes gene_type:complete
MSDDDDKIVSLLEERQKRIKSSDIELEEKKESLPPWFMMDDDKDSGDYFAPISDNPFLLITEAIVYIERAEVRIKRMHSFNSKMHKSSMIILFIVLVLTLTNFIMLFSISG